jgi:homoserine kinase type II
LSEQQLHAYAEAFGLGSLQEIHPIAAGSVNTNYRLVCSGGSYFLRVNEAKGEADVDYEVALVDHLRAAGVPTAGPVFTRDGGVAIAHPAGPISVFHWVPGEPVSAAEVTPHHTEALGRHLAELHIAGSAFARHRPQPYGEVELWRRMDRIQQATLGDEVLEPLTPRLREALVRWSSERSGELPAGAIHADLFCDNVLWRGPSLAALIDFEQAGDGPWLYDLAVCLHSWCFSAPEQPDAYLGERALALVRGYESVRPVRPAEREALFAEASWAALRFTVTRITDFHLRPAAGLRVEKEFGRYWRRYQQLQRLGPEGLATLVGWAP